MAYQRRRKKRSKEAKQLQANIQSKTNSNRGGIPLVLEFHFDSVVAYIFGLKVIVWTKDKATFKEHLIQALNDVQEQATDERMVSMWVEAAFERGATRAKSKTASHRFKQTKPVRVWKRNRANRTGWSEQK